MKLLDNKKTGKVGDVVRDGLRHKEGAKIKCGEKHFAVLATGENPAKYIKAASVADMLSNG